MSPRALCTTLAVQPCVLALPVAYRAPISDTPADGCDVAGRVAIAGAAWTDARRLRARAVAGSASATIARAITPSALRSPMQTGDVMTCGVDCASSRAIVCGGP